jgi:hypothetical protein
MSPMRRNADDLPSSPSCLDPLERDSQTAPQRHHRGNSEPPPNPTHDTDPLADAAFEHACSRAADEPTPPQDLEPVLSQRWIHAGWRHTRSQVFDALRRTEQPAARVQAFAECGSTAIILQSRDNPSDWKIAGSRCHDRFCQRCAGARAHAIAYNVIDYLADRETRFLTLTVKHDDASLAMMLDHLTRSFRTLRRRPLWKKCVTGGVAFLEIKWSAASQSWHPHFHILIVGKYLDWQKLKAEWWRITGDSHVIDIRAIRNRDQAFHYVCKYASKPLNNTFANRPPLLDEAIRALRGRKLAHTFGDCRGLVLIEKPDDAAWEPRGSLNDWIKRARRGDAEAQNVLLGIAANALAADLLTPGLYEADAADPDPPVLIQTGHDLSHAQFQLFANMN